MNKLNQQLMDYNNFINLTKVQEKVLNNLKHVKSDLIVQARTGTGKTHAFLFSIIETIEVDEETTQAILIAPTRELAMQIYDFAKPIKELEGKYRIELAIGGMDGTRLDKKITKSPHMIIGTPGKILELMDKNLIRLDTVKLCILDEMDMILDYGFINDTDKIASHLGKDTRFMLFSATYPKGLKHFIKRYLHHPIEIIVEDEKGMAPNIKHILVNQRHRDGNEMVLDVMGSIQPSLGIVFTNTIKEADSLYEYLLPYGINMALIHGDIDSRRRKQILKQIQNKQVNYIIATDLAARGWDLPEISHVINLNLPNHDLSFYDHRVGRTGRSGRDGSAITIVSDKDRKSVEKLQSKGTKFEYAKPGKGQLVEVRPFMEKRQRQMSVDPEVAAILNRKKVKVKPGYKKARKHEIQKLQSQRRRNIIKASIQEQKKARAKKKAQDNKGN